MSNQWEEANVEIHHVGQQNLKQGDVEEKTNNILYPLKDPEWKEDVYDKAVESYLNKTFLTTGPDIGYRNEDTEDKIKWMILKGSTMEPAVMESDIRSGINELINKGKDRVFLPHNHLKQVDGAAEVYSLIGGKVNPNSITYEKIREQSVETMRQNKTYQFCMLLAGFNNDKMDRYWITPSETLVKKPKRKTGIKELQKRKRELNLKLGKLVKVEQISSTDEGSSQSSNDSEEEIIGQEARQTYENEKRLKEEKKKKKREKYEKKIDNIDKQMENINKQLQDYTPKSLGFHDWYTSTSWADGRLHLSPIVYSHIEEGYNVVRLKWTHLKGVPLDKFIESDGVRSYFARLVSWCMRTSDCLSGKKFHLQSTYRRVNVEKAKLLNIFRHVRLQGDELIYERKGDTGIYIPGNQSFKQYLDQKAFIDHRAMKIPKLNRHEDVVLSRLMATNKALDLSKQFNKYNV